MDKILKKIDSNLELDSLDLKTLLSIKGTKELEKLFTTAYNVKLRNIGNTVYFRGLVEVSNICKKDCFYCGIRKSNVNIDRFLIPENDVIESAMWSQNANYGSIVLQSGERSDPQFVDSIERIIKGIKYRSNGKLGITLSIGEQSFKTYQRWFAAGAHRYLLRIESSNPELYQKLHPDDKKHDWEKRLKCLDFLRDAGFQVGTGVMIGLPFQTLDDLVNDILFFKKQNIDMIGMGPFIFHQDTPFQDLRKDWEKSSDDALLLGLKMIAVTRIFLKDVNIAATTALHALAADGRERGILAGANIMMPNTTETKYRAGYQLYENKPGIDENAETSRLVLENKILDIGEKIGYNQWGDSPHFSRRNKFKA